MNLCPVRRSVRDQRGSVVALFVLFMPVVLAVCGLALDLGILFTARKCVQGACDLGALAGVQELDWDALARGHILIREEDAVRRALEVAYSNMGCAGGLVFEPDLSARVYNPPFREEPCVIVEASFSVRSFFIHVFVPVKQQLFRVLAEASVVTRTKW